MAKNTIVFDFDDTLVYTNQIFVDVKNKFYQMMRQLGLFDQELSRVLNEFDVANVREKGGLKKECFPLALQQTYAHYCRIKRKPFSPAQSESFSEMGHSVYSEPVKAVPGAKELLSDLQGKYRLALLTQGDQEAQKARLESSGFLGHFEAYYIVRKKDSGAYLRIVEDFKVLPASSWSIGNSIRYDINPAIAAGFKVIHIDIPCWDFERVEPLGSFHRVKGISECRKFLL